MDTLARSSASNASSAARWTPSCPRRRMTAMPTFKLTRRGSSVTDHDSGFTEPAASASSAMIRRKSARSSSPGMRRSRMACATAGSDRSNALAMPRRMQPWHARGQITPKHTVHHRMVRVRRGRYSHARAKKGEAISPGTYGDGKEKAASVHYARGSGAWRHGGAAVLFSSMMRGSSNRGLQGANSRPQQIPCHFLRSPEF
jgi:hypothetical protein